MHEKGLIHRDIKEENIFLHTPPGSGRVYIKIADFGLVKVQKRINESTLVSVAGTYPYLSPEFILGNEDEDAVIANSKIDVWSEGPIKGRL
ncbi:MAG: hypothetical protein EZS28_028278 [Streblomastix strix]|uniref:Protein kinase domain-containing protein n=1 Tax=Streblomastix strix TaxID=222440 RepID=A0A5J4UZP3_9EUKA|nr:MAG: hypothetical protein EZS28_028278 [Streblomastix strix]